MCRPHRHFGAVALHNRALRIIGKSGEEVEQEARHGIALVGVDVLGHRQKPYVQCNQLLNAFDRVRNASSPAV